MRSVRHANQFVIFTQTIKRGWVRGKGFFKQDGGSPKKLTYKQIIILAVSTDADTVSLPTGIKVEEAHIAAGYEVKKEAH